MSNAPTNSTISRRAAISAAGAGLAASLGNRLSPSTADAQEATPAAAATIADSLSVEILQAFRDVPGTLGLKLWAPENAGRPAWSVEHKPNEKLFIASAFKSFVLAAALRQLEDAVDPSASTPPAAQIAAGLQQLLPLNDSVFSLDSSVFNPPHLTGDVSLRTALEAMISHSDNTGADIVLKHIGADNVQAFVDGIGLTQTQIPLSTRAFIGYIMGLPDWQNTTWAQLEAGQFPDPRPIMNDTISMASSASDLVAFYARALSGDLFQHASSLATFRATLANSDAIPQVVPLGGNGFGKGGQVAANGTYGISIAGGMYVPQRWVYFAILQNWTEADGDVADVMSAYVEAVQSTFRLLQDHFTS